MVIEPKCWKQKDGKWLYGGKKLTATKAIHQHCSTDCQLSAQQARKCENRECRFWGFREGKNINRYQRAIVKRDARSGKIMPLNKAGKSKPPDLSNRIFDFEGKRYKLTEIAKEEIGENAKNVSS